MFCQREIESIPFLTFRKTNQILFQQFRLTIGSVNKLDTLLLSVTTNIVQRFLVNSNSTGQIYLKVYCDVLNKSWLFKFTHSHFLIEDHSDAISLAFCIQTQKRIKVNQLENNCAQLRYVSLGFQRTAFDDYCSFSYCHCEGKFIKLIWLLDSFGWQMPRIYIYGIQRIQSK